jgi:glucosamine--fructose-6-phosphate aminotransferase (isomerizing)
MGGYHGMNVPVTSGAVPRAALPCHISKIASIATDEERAEDNQGNKKLQAYGALVVAMTNGMPEVKRYADRALQVLEMHERVPSVLVNVQLQLTAYYMPKRLSQLINNSLIKT